MNLRLRERMRLIGYHDLTTSEVSGPYGSELLEWYGEERDAERVATAIEHTLSRVANAKALVTVYQVDLIVDLDSKP